LPQDDGKKAVLSTRITDLVTVLVLWGTFFLALVLPLMLGLLFIVTGTLFVVFNRARLDRITVILLLNIAYWLFSGLLVGSIAPHDILKPAFLNGEGRILISYSPLLLFGAAAVQWSNVEILVKTIFQVALASLFFLAVWMATGASFLSEGMSGNYAGFLTSHTGGGTFFGVLSIFLILFGHLSGKRLVHYVGWLMVIPMLASASREAMLAFLVVAVWYVLKMRNRKVLIGAIIAVTIFTSLMPVLLPHTWDRTASLFSTALLEDVVEQIDASKDIEPSDGGMTEERDENLVGASENILARVMFWTYALRRFSQSPIFGIGFGRYNDSSLDLAGIEGLVYMAFGGEKMFSVGNAHNSYFHTLCESGLVGLTLLLWLWSSIYFRLLAAAREYQDWKAMRSLMIASQGMVVFALFSALTGHALASPSLMLPLTTVAGVALAAQRSFMPFVQQRRIAMRIAVSS
jgi:O-antigen ligase